MSHHRDLRYPAPAGAETILDVLDDAAAQGFDTQLVARAGGRIECTACGQQNQPATFEVQRVRRLEGASDPADLLLVVYSPCPTCQQGGVLTIGYGPNADDIDTAILQDLDITNADTSPTDQPGTENTITTKRSSDSARALSILIGVDETTESRDAVRAAWDLFGDRASYTIVCIYERQPLITGTLGIGTDLDGLYAHLDNSVGQQLATNAASAARTAAPTEAEINFHTEVGHAGQTIVDVATDRTSDLIVIGSHSRSFWDSLFTPSVSKHLVDHAPCPVLVVRST